jgi:hypothetical protein
MRILLTGANGFIGSALLPFLQLQEHAVVRLVRHSPTTGDIIWNPEKGQLDAPAINGFDAVIHLAGANIAGKRWTKSYKREIWDSRIKSTELLVARLSEVANPPSVLICASATGYYGNRGDEILTEESTPGTGFLAELCVGWEQSSQSISARGTRVVNLRNSMVLSANGGALKKMLLPFKLGLGGRLGSGNQYWSWIALDDYLAAVEFILSHNNLKGAVNMVAPEPVTNREFTLALAHSLRRAASIPVPAIVLHTIFGEMANGLFFASQRVTPYRLTRAGYEFLNPLIRQAVETLLKA